MIPLSRKGGEGQSRDRRSISDQAWKRPSRIFDQRARCDSDPLTTYINTTSR
jgi:hypothetical protein